MPILSSTQITYYLSNQVLKLRILSFWAMFIIQYSKKQHSVSVTVNSCFCGAQLSRYLHAIAAENGNRSNF
jgi:hypothetical protein